MASSTVVHTHSDSDGKPSRQTITAKRECLMIVLPWARGWALRPGPRPAALPLPTYGGITALERRTPTRRFSHYSHVVSVLIWSDERVVCGVSLSNPGSCLSMHQPEGAYRHNGDFATPEGFAETTRVGSLLYLH